MEKLSCGYLGFVFAAALGLLAGSPKLASAQATCADPKAADFKKETLVPNGQLKEPIELSVTKDGRVFVVERAGNVMLYNPSTHLTTVALALDVYINPGAYDVGGILGVTVHPDFPANDWVYVYYAPKALFSGANNNATGKLSYRLSRFRFVSDHLDLPSEQIFFEVPSVFETHNSGSLKFGKDGDLYLSTGDNSNAAENEQFSPMDERLGHEYDDDQRSTANTNDLRGKILRIHPEAVKQSDGKYYSIPAGNLFPVGTEKTRPEIYTMGHRNPYRIFPDPVTGRLYIGEFGPAAQATTDRGPAGADQLKVTDTPAFLGYPFFLKDNQPYCHWDYATLQCTPIAGQTGMKYDPARPLNNSRNNTGLQVLPPAHPAVLWEHDGPSTDPIPGLKTCGFGAGPVYYFDSSSTSKVKFPPFFDGKWTFFGIYAGGWSAKLTTVPAGPVGAIKAAVNPPWVGAPGVTFTAGIHDMEYGLGDGALYIVDYGSGHYTNNGDAGLSRITYNGCLPPVVSLADRGAKKSEANAFLALTSGTRLRAPIWAQGLQVYDLSGRLVYEKHFTRESASGLTWPRDLGMGLFRVRWQP